MISKRFLEGFDNEFGFVGFYGCADGVEEDCLDHL
jgi:hypothetical protein